MDNGLVSVIIANWNGKRFLRTCLASLLAQTYTHVEIIVVDNASSDGSIQLIRDEFPSVNLVTCDHNYGFAAANNTGFHVAKGTFLATINNDTRAEPRWLEMLVTAMDSDPSVGMCASKMISWNDPSKIDSAGIAVSRAGIAWDRFGGMVDSPDDLHPVEIFGPCAGAALYRRDLIERTGGFDERFFAYLEDVDLAWRAQWLGWRCLYVPTARVLHYHSGTSNEGSPFKTYLLGRNKIWTLYKNVPLSLAKLLPIIIAYDLMAVAYAVFHYRNVSAACGRVAAILHLGGSLRQKRRIVQQNTSVMPPRWLQLLEPVDLPWVIARRFSHLRSIHR